MRILRWFHTARYLPARQALAWARRRLARPRRVRIRGDGAVDRGPGWRAICERMRGLEASFREPDRTFVDLALEHRFKFLNEEHVLSEIDWSADYGSPLWTYHLHYFDFAVDLALAFREAGDVRYRLRCEELWTAWLDAARRGEARIEPYPTSVRCCNALRSAWLMEGHAPDDFVDRLLAATHEQLLWLADNLERHLGANHLQKNLVALSLGSLAFGSAAAAEWRRHLEALWETLREHVLPDGGHFERSPMYHAAALDDWLLTLAACDAAAVAAPDDVRPRLAKMTHALLCLSRPDGTLHLFNDAANSERPERDAVVALASDVLERAFTEPSGVFALDQTGYYGRIDAGAGSRFVVDAGPPGPAHQPGHAHCDMLSFEFDIAGRPVVVDAGVHGYDGDPYREYVRSTRAHNTVAIDGREQHEMWATFRMARRGKIVEASASQETEVAFAFEGSCRHYHDARALHRRKIELDADVLAVTDRVEGANGCPLTSWLHLHPDFEVEPLGDRVVATAKEGTPLGVAVEVFGADGMSVKCGDEAPLQGWYCPEFGLARPAAAIVLHVHANDERDFGYRVRPLP